MSTHISDDLPRLLTGEATRDEVLAAASHLRTCADCQQELVAAVVAHASLTSARRYAPEIVARIGAVVDADSADPEPADDVLPDLTEMFAKVRAEAEAAPARVRPIGRSRTRVLSAVAAAAVVVGGGVAAGVALTSGGGTTASPSAEQVQLAAYDTGTSPAKATLSSDGTLHVDAASLAHAPASHRYEVWLTNSARTRMQPIGWIGADGTATLTVPGDLADHYSDIEVSVQKVDASTYNYSGTSVLRGAYR